MHFVHDLITLTKQMKRVVLEKLILCVRIKSSSKKRDLRDLWCMLSISVWSWNYGELMNCGHLEIFPVLFHWFHIGHWVNWSGCTFSIQAVAIHANRIYWARKKELKACQVCARLLLAVIIVSRFYLVNLDKGEMNRISTTAFTSSIQAEHISLKFSINIDVAHRPKSRNYCTCYVQCWSREANVIENERKNVKKTRKKKYKSELCDIIEKKKVISSRSYGIETRTKL